MLTIDDAREMIDDLFETEAMALGGLVALHGADDQLVRRLVRNMDATRTRALRRLEEKNALDVRTMGKPHPAIQEFLLKLRSSGRMGETA